MSQKLGKVHCVDGGEAGGFLAVQISENYQVEVSARKHHGLFGGLYAMELEPDVARALADALHSVANDVDRARPDAGNTQE